MLDKLRNKNFRFLNYLEFLVSVIIIISIIIEGGYLITQIFKMPFAEEMDVYFSDFLGDALNLVIGLEFIKMLNGHNPELVIDVLIYTIARSLVVQHPDNVGILLGVISITILFVVRKFVFGEKRRVKEYLKEKYEELNDTPDK